MDWTLSDHHRCELRTRFQETTDAAECRRCEALLMLDEGNCSVKQIAHDFGVSRQTLYNWRERLPATGDVSLKDRARTGRPSVWCPERVELLQTLLNDTPRQHGFHARGWTVSLLQKRLEQLLDWRVSEDSLRTQLHELDYVWKRYRYVLKPDPQREKKKTNPQANSGFAAKYGCSVSGRNGRDVVSSAAFGVDASR
jgi:transposase